MGSTGQDVDGSSKGDASYNYDVVIVGGGFSGVYLLNSLVRQSGSDFKVHLIEAAPEVGGVWYWNAYPGIRVDTEVPCYQFSNNNQFDNPVGSTLAPQETWQEWSWTQTFPDGKDLKGYFQYLTKKWNLQQHISFNTRVKKMTWDKERNQWTVDLENNDGGQSSTSTEHAKHVILCTGFASKPYIPAFKNRDKFKGEIYHTSHWPQTGVNLKDRRVAVIGTGATGIQVIQEVSKVASQLTVFQRTPNAALPMSNNLLDQAGNEQLRTSFPGSREKMLQTFAGVDFDFAPQAAMQLAPEERKQGFEKLYTAGGLNFWLGTYFDVLFVQEANDEAYAFWRAKTLPRIKSKRDAEILAPEKPPHPFGTKRVSLEQGYFEVFNQDNVELIDVNTQPIAEFTANGIRTTTTTDSTDGTSSTTNDHEFDIIVLATGYDSVTGGITQIDIHGLNPDPSATLEQKWKKGVHTYLGMTTHDYPNLFFTYGPQAPTAFATGPMCAETQGDWIVKFLQYMREGGYVVMNPTEDAEREYRDLIMELSTKGLFSKADSGWYFGGNIPGKTKEPLNFMGGLPMYRTKLQECAENGYKGFDFSK